MFVRCGKLTCCDYLYLFVRVNASGPNEWVGFIGDAKHTVQAEKGAGDAVTAADQRGLFNALRNSDGRIAYVVRFAGRFQSEWIQWLCESTLESLGLVFPTITLSNTKYTLQVPLGSGQHSHGYELKLGEDTVVVKQFSDFKMAAHEREICKAFENVWCDASFRDSTCGSAFRRHHTERVAVRFDGSQNHCRSC